MKLLATTIFFCLVALSPMHTFAEENHGPHAGYVKAGVQDPKAPGTSVTINAELLKRSDTEITVYMIDQSWGEVDLKDTTIKISYVPQKGKKTELSCKENMRALNCPLPKGAKWSDGDKVIINRTKKGEAGLVFEYTYPFKHGV